MVEDCCETVERNGGRRERRTCTVLGEWVADPAAWPGLCSLIRVQAERNGPRGRQRFVRYYISSLPVNAEVLLELVRGHWREPSGWENGRHRTLDVQFREDDCRLHRGHGPAVMGILRRAALNMVRTVQQNCCADVSIGLLRIRIGCHPWSLGSGWMHLACQEGPEQLCKFRLGGMKGSHSSMGTCGLFRPIISHRGVGSVSR